MSAPHALRRRKSTVRRVLDACRIAGWVILATVLVAVAARSARAQAAESAGDPLERCVDLYWEGRFDEAIPLLEELTGALSGGEKYRAYEFLARSLVRTGRREEAGAAFKSILRADPEWRPDRQMLAEPEWVAFEEVLEEFRNETLGALNVRTEPARAQIFLGGVAQAGLTPFTLERLPAGEHAVRLEKDGFAPFDTTLVVEPSSIAVLEVELEPAPAEAAAAAPFWKKGWVQVTGGLLGAGLILALLGGGGGDDGGGETGGEDLPGFPEPPGR